MISKRGFTLIELLVVVLIIGILSAIALPQYTKAIHKARFAENLLRVKRLEQAVDLYVLENGYPTTAIDLIAQDPDLANGLEPHEVLDSWWTSKYSTYYAARTSHSPSLKWASTYNYASGNTLVELGGDKSEDGTWSRYCYYEDEIGKALCTPLAASGYDEVSYGF